VKFTIKVLALLVGTLILANVANAQSAREQLQQLTTQLQRSPADQALRENIIKLALTLDPKPSIPDAATLSEGAAEYAFKNAQNTSDYSDAAKQYEKALLIAPWIAADYFNCGVAHEKAGENNEAIRSFNLYILAAPNADDLQGVKKRIGGLQYAAQKAADDASRPAREAAMRDAAAREADERMGFTNNLDGTVTDHRAALMWQREYERKLRNWEDSMNYCRSLSLAGHSDWHLPDKEELLSLGRNYLSKMERGSNIPIYEGNYFPSAMEQRGLQFWSSWSDPADGSAYAGRFQIIDGSVISGRKSFLFYARCVRPGR
jgi:tetratricopeptide (TPR) repeat protein